MILIKAHRICIIPTLFSLLAYGCKPFFHKVHFAIQLDPNCSVAFSKGLE